MTTEAQMRAGLAARARVGKIITTTVPDSLGVSLVKQYPPCPAGIVGALRRGEIVTQIGARKFTVSLSNSFGLSRNVELRGAERKYNGADDTLDYYKPLSSQSCPLIDYAN